MRVAMAAVLLGVVSCANPGPSNETFRLFERSFGVYEIQGRATELIEETTDVACELGVAFGVQMTLEVSGTSGGIIPLAAEILSPPIEGVRPAIRRITPDPFVVPAGFRSGPIHAGYSFDRPEELLDGRYSIRFFNSDTGMLVYKRTFVVSGCS